MTDHEAAVHSLRRRIGALLSLRYALAAIAAWCFAWGLAVIVLRAALLVDRLPLMWGAMGVAGAVILGIVMGLRKLPAHRAVRAAIDRHQNAGGMVMAAEEADMNAWRDHTSSSGGGPKLRWRGGKTTGLCAVAVAFVAVTFAMPDWLVATNRAQPLDVSADARQLTDQIAVLEQEKILQPEAAQQIKDKLDQVRDEARGDDPVKTWAALDRLQENLANTAMRAAEEAVKSTERLSETEALAKTLEQAGEALDAKTLADAMNDMADMVHKALSAKDLPAGALDAATMEKIAKAMEGLAPGDLPKLDAETLAKIAAACKACKGDIKQMIEKLAEAKLVEAKMCEACDKAGEADVAELVKWLQENGGDCEGVALAELAAECKGLEPGQGGISRGRGDAPMTWQDPTADDGAKFKAQALPPASLAALKESKLMGVSTGDPTKQVDPATLEGGALAGAAAGGGSAHTHVVLPKHRGAVERFFDREGN